MGRIAPIHIVIDIFIAKCKRITSHQKWKNNTFRIRNWHAAHTHHSMYEIINVLCAEVFEDECRFIELFCTRFTSWANAYDWNQLCFFVQFYSSTIYIYKRPARRVVVRVRIFTAYLLTCKSHTEYLLIWDHQPQIISLDELYFFFCSPRNSHMICVLCLQYMAYKSHTSATHATNYINRTLNECAFEYEQSRARE